MEVKISCLNCTNYCQNGDLDKLLNELDRLRQEEGCNKVIIKCEVLKNCLKNAKSNLEIIFE